MRGTNSWELQEEGAGSGEMGEFRWRNETSELGERELEWEP